LAFNQQNRNRFGVMSGGTQGRLGTFHMGTTGAQKGGFNTAGSKPGIAKPPRNPFARPAKPKPNPVAALLRPTPRPKPAVNSHGPATNKPRPMTKPLPHPGVATPAAPTPSVPSTNPLDYRSQAGYIRGMAFLRDGLAQDRRGLQSQLEEGQRVYTQSMGDARRGYTDDLYRGNASAAARGITFSGMREDNDADRFREFDRHMADIEQQYGTGLSARVNEALAELERREAFEREELEGQYRDEWSALHPAAPIGEPEAAAPGGVAPGRKDPSRLPSRDPGRPSARAPHPNANTYTDQQGNLREFGTGRLLRRASGGIGPAPRPGTPAPVPVGAKPVVKPRVPPRNPAARR
jgi:hypothetical protein